MEFALLHSYKQTSVGFVFLYYLFVPPPLKDPNKKSFSVVSASVAGKWDNQINCRKCFDESTFIHKFSTLPNESQDSIYA
jgi:hypothetical protein